MSDESRRIDYEARQRALGFARTTTWYPARDKEKLKKYVQGLSRRYERELKITSAK